MAQALEKKECMKKRKVRYTGQLPRAMYCFFRSFSDQGAPGFRKFADSIGATLEDIESWREHEEFERAYRECSEIRRDYLIDNALTRRFDPTFVKYLLSLEYGEKDCAEEELAVKLEVIK
jgi:hypothetical protein